MVPYPVYTILLTLHLTLNHLGHGQSGEFFRCKTRFLQPKAKQVVLNALQQDPSKGPVDVVEFHYPSAKLPVNPDQPPGENNFMWAWGYGDIDGDRIEGLEKSVQSILRYIDKHGPFIGVMGFSTGATVAAIITSLLEKRKSLCNFEFNVSAFQSRIWSLHYGTDDFFFPF
jgi:hypothetical protein